MRATSGSRACAIPTNFEAPASTHLALRDVGDKALPRSALLGNGSAIEELIDDHRDFGFGIEPFDEFGSGVAVADAVIECLPYFGREVCYFSVSMLHICILVWVEYLH